MVAEVSKMFEDELTPTRRQFPRIPAENVVMIHRLGPTEQPETATARQISLGGLMISSPEPLGVDAYLRLKVAVEAEEIEATGRVVWERPADDGTYDVGVAFISIDTDNADTLITQMVQADAR
jgi:hypothetical protein